MRRGHQQGYADEERRDHESTSTPLGRSIGFTNRPRIAGRVLLCLGRASVVIGGVAPCVVVIAVSFLVSPRMPDAQLAECSNASAHGSLSVD